MFLWEENCKLIDYDYIKEKSKCSWAIKINFENVVKFDKKLYLIISKMWKKCSI